MSMVRQATGRAVAEQRIKAEGYAFLAAYALCIPVANWMIEHVGTVCPSDGPCLLPVAPGVLVPSGVVMIGLALVLRDLVQRRLGVRWAIGAIVVGGALSAAVAPKALVIASCTAFLLSEFADFAVYTPLQRRRLVLAVLASSMVGLVVDSALFLTLAFGNLDYFWPQVIGKSWVVVLSLPLIALLRDRDRRLDIQPAR